MHMTTTDLRADAPGQRAGPRPADGRGEAVVRVWLLLIVLDLAVSAAAWVVTFSLCPVPLAIHWILALAGIAAATTVVSIAAKGLYREHVRRVRTVEISGLGRAGLVGAVAVGLLDDRFSADTGMRWPLVGLALSTASLVAARGVAAALVRAARRNGHLQRRVLLVGESGTAAHLASDLARNPGEGYLVVGAVGDELAHRFHGVEAPHLGTLDDLERALVQSRASWAIVTPNGLGRKDATEVIRRLMVAGVNVELAGSLGLHHRRLRATAIGHETAFYVERVDLTGPQRILKRAIDITGATLGLIVLGPVLVASAAAVLVSDRRPVLFRQRRVGKDGVPFTMLKLRSMVMDAEDLRSALEAGNRRNGPLFKLADDPRVTRVGRVLRATSIDELPQLWNVLRGDMSLVGPRPALPSEVARFGNDLNRRHAVRPGITGLWQVEARDSDLFADVERHDLFYVENWSVLLDLGLLARTLGGVAFRAVRALRRDPRTMA